MSVRILRLLLLAMVLIVALAPAPVAAQDEPLMLLLDTQIGMQPDGFGGETQIVTGELYNHDLGAYRNINLFIEAYDQDENLIGEGFGFLVDACGTALLDYALPPGRSQAYSAPFELFDGGEVARVAVRIDADHAEPEEKPDGEMPAAHLVDSREAVMLQWLDDDALIYGLGCADDVFTELDWWLYVANRSKSGNDPPSLSAPCHRRDDRAQRRRAYYAIGRAESGPLFQVSNDLSAERAPYRLSE